jgi:hypothetical protein
MDLLGIALIIITVVVSVHVVYERGKQAGVSEGRQQILHENVKRAHLNKEKFDNDLETVMSKINSCA